MDESQSHQKEIEVLEAYHECYDQGIRNWGTWIEEANKDMAFYLGEQWSAREKSMLNLQGRAALVFNKCRRIIKLIEGYERKTRVSLISEPIESGDQKTSEQLSAMLLWQMNVANMHMTMSDAFAGALKTGMNLVSLSLDYSDDPLSGDIKLSRHPHNSYILDPRFERRDLQDCEYIIQRKYLSRDAVKALIPFRADEVDMILQGGRDDKFPDMSISKDPGGKELLRFDEFWIRKYRTINMLVDQETGEMTKWPGERDERLGLYLATFPNVKLIQRPEKYIELNVIVEDQLMYSGDSPWKLNDFPHIPVMAFWDPEYNSISADSDFSMKLQGIIRPIRDSQIEVNKRRSKALDIIDSAVNTGWVAKENSVANPQDLYQTGQGKVIWRKDDSDPTDLFRLEPPNVPPQLLQLGEVFDRDLMEIAGANSELMGMPENENMPISGILSKVRQGAGLTILQDVFDHFRFSQKMLGTKLIKLIQLNYHPSKVARVLSEQPTREFFDASNTKFDVTVEEAIETPSQKNLYYLQLMQARQAGIPIPDSLIIEAMPIQGKDKVMEALQQQEAAAAKAQQIQMQQQQDLHEMSQAQKFNDLATAQSKIAKSDADTALARWRLSEAQENHADTVLQRIEAVQKIQEMDDNAVIRLIEFMRSLEQDLQASNQLMYQQNKQAQAQSFANLAAPLVADEQNIQQPGMF